MEGETAEFLGTLPEYSPTLRLNDIYLTALEEQSGANTDLVELGTEDEAVKVGDSDDTIRNVEPEPKNAFMKRMSLKSGLIELSDDAKNPPDNKVSVTKSERSNGVIKLEPQCEIVTIDDEVTEVNSPKNIVESEVIWLDWIKSEIKPFLQGMWKLDL